ncbi:YkvA family protein [Paratissierella segnis]|jgi:uncharacterized membrane protein YkvA (DUF1232 family)|uniref:DUF1232 domain-containing protein n=1 Tax=Paratissierella segnis TaxID=2763679 RepID=A0A926ILJ5_9FIRM|nr:DUF1232 domain-containing protein [Paratissierella segnis]MBC8589440.1 DUF1232 domain-containing protein [Paratissierella segnis]
MKINFENIINSLSEKARLVSLDNSKLRDLLTKTLKTLEENEELKSIIEDIKMLVQLVKDWMSGRYKGISNSSIIMVIISFLYLVTPIDIIPDFLIGGFLDDAAVIAYIIKKITAELEVYKEWRKGEDNVIEIEIEDEDEEDNK